MTEPPAALAELVDAMAEAEGISRGEAAGRISVAVAKRDAEPQELRYKWGAKPLPPDGVPQNPGMTECCGGSVYNAHGFGICWGPRWVGRLRGYRRRRHL